MSTIIKHSPLFDKHFKKRISRNKKLLDAFKERVSLFVKNSKHPLLKDHQLIGNKDTLRSFSITGDYRLIYKKLSRGEVIFYDIGSHNQVC
jgi:addiction module RelE/StbE family toxin